MTEAKLNPWWKRKDHRRVHGSRGARFVSLRGHLFIIGGLLGLVLFVMRASADDVAYRVMPPPVPAPPPLPRSLGYTLTSEMPYMQRLETELNAPSHVPQKESLNFEGLRTTGRVTNSTMSIDYQDGGAFAECLFVQYPKGLGRQPLAPTVVGRLQALHAAAGTPIPTTTSTSEATATANATVTAAPSFSAPVSFSALVLLPATAPQRSSTNTNSSNTKLSKEQELAATTARTRDALADALQTKQPPPSLDESSFDSRRRRVAATGTLVISVARNNNKDATAADPAPIVRSPTKAPKRSVLEVEAAKARSNDALTTTTTTPADGQPQSSASTTDSANVAVPFCVSSWRNKKNLIIPIEQRLAQQTDDRTSADGGLSTHVMDLAMAMRKAEKDVSQELQQRAAARAADEERRQAAVEADEMRRARQLMEENATRLAQQQQQQSRRGETREQRLERLRLERDLREREKAHQQRQRQLQKAAARLNMSVEDLEADENLLKALDRGEENGGATTPAASHVVGKRYSTAAQEEAMTSHPVKRERPAGTDELDDEDNDGAGRRKKSTFQMFMRPVVSNEGIAREMEALAALEKAGGGSAATAAVSAGPADGLKLPGHDNDEKDDDEDEDDDEDGGFALNKLVHRRQRLL